MYASPMAEWLDSFFAGYDHFFLNILHVLGDKAGTVLTPLMRVITFVGEKGIVFFLLALIFMLMADKRDLGVCIFGAVCCGALITNIILKDSVGRVRPFEAVAEYNAWWQAIGAPAEDGCSFPSGHVTACAAGMTAITLMRGKKWILPSVLIIFFMGVSRNYLMAHYPSDVLFAVLIGVFSGVVAWLITQVIFRFLRRSRRRIPVCAVILDFDIRDVLPIPGFGGKGGSKAAAPARLGKKRAPEPPAQPDPDDDVKTYSGSSRRSRAPASKEDFDDEAPVRRRSAAKDFSDAAPKRVRPAAADFADAAPKRSRAAAEDFADAPPAARRSRSSAEPAGIFPRRSARAAEPAKEAPAEESAPRRSRTASASGRHAVEPAAKESASRSLGKLRAPSGYQGKHVK